MPTDEPTTAELLAEFRDAYVSREMNRNGRHFALNEFELQIYQRGYREADGRMHEVMRTLLPRIGWDGLVEASDAMFQEFLEHGYTKEMD